MTKKMGRPIKLNERRRKTILDAFSNGLPMSDAAAMAGISVMTLRRWLERGAEAIEARDRGEKLPQMEHRFRHFCEDVREVQALNIQQATSCIQKAIRGGDVSAAFRYLERRRPETYGQITRTEVSGPSGTPVEVRHSGSIAEAIAAAKAKCPEMPLDEWDPDEEEQD